MNSIVLDGAEAVAERQRLLQDGREIAATLKERDATGRRRTTSLQFGLGPSTAWVYCRDEREGMEAIDVLEAVLVEEAVELFQGYLERMEMRRSLVDPSPLSAAFAEITPGLDEIVSDLQNSLGVEVNPWG